MIVKPVIEVPSITVTAPGEDSVSVRFDKFTHSSGELRAYVQCGRADHAHGRLYRLYRQVSGFPSKRNAAAFLTAWAWQGRDLAAVSELSAKEMHRRFRPPPDFVATVFALVPE